MIPTDNSNNLPSSLAVLLAELDRNGVTDFRRYQAVRSYMNFRAREKDIPISGVFELTPLCNLDCKMCYVHLEKSQIRTAELLSPDKWKDIIRQAVSCGMMYAKLTGGECLTYHGFKEIYLYLRESGIETSILSNGVLMDEQTVEFLKENPPASIQITLYGASEDAYESVTGHKVFSKILNNIKNIMQAKIPLTVAITPNSFMNDGEDIVRLVHSLGLSVIINSGLMMPREETGRKKTDADIDTYISMFKIKNELQGISPVEKCDAEDPLPYVQDSATSPKGVTCGAGRSTFSISWRGEMRPCNTFPMVVENVLETGFSEAWKRINSQVKEYPLPIECEGCRYKQLCKHCVAEHFSGAPSGHANPAICDWMHRMAAEGLV